MFILILSIVAIGAISCVSAEDLNSAQDLAIDENVEITQINELSTIDEDNSLKTDINEESIETSEVNAKITPIILSGEYINGKATVKLSDIQTNEPLNDKTIKLSFDDAVQSFTNKTNEEGIATFNFKNLEYNNTFYKLFVGNWGIKFDSDINEGVVADTVTGNLTIQKLDATLKVNELSVSYGSKKNLTISLTDSATGRPIDGEILKMKMTNTASEYYYFQTDKNGKSYVNVDALKPGTYQAVISLNSTQNINAAPVSTKVVINKIKATIKASKLTTTYNSGKYFSIKVTKSNGVVAGLKLKLKVYTGSKYKTVYLKTGSDGIAKYKTSGLSKGTHKIVIINTNSSTFTVKSVSSSVVINPKKLYIAGEDYKFKQGGGLMIGAYNIQSDKFIKGVKLQIKIYKNSKKYRTFNLVTGYDKKTGLNIIIIETNQFSAGTHKVSVKITSPNYKGSESGTITIPKSSKNYSKFTYVFTNGKGKYV